MTWESRHDAKLLQYNVKDLWATDQVSVCVADKFMFTPQTSPPPPACLLAFNICIIEFVTASARTQAAKLKTFSSCTEEDTAKVTLFALFRTCYTASNRHRADANIYIYISAASNTTLEVLVLFYTIMQHIFVKYKEKGYA